MAAVWKDAVRGIAGMEKDMKNGYFQLENVSGALRIRIYPPVDNGERVRINEVADYLSNRNYVYDLHALMRAVESGEETTIPVVQGSSVQEERESYLLHVEEDNMLVTARFYAPSLNGEKMTYEEFVKDLQFRRIIFGICEKDLQDFFTSQDRPYCTDIKVAEGVEPRQGKDARIEYYFNTDLSTKPTLKEDGSVDFFHLNTISPCKKGELLAKIIPADEGDYGNNVLGERLKPRVVKRVSLRYGRNIQLSEDRLSISSMVDGHVTLVEGKVFVSDVFTVENVDNSTGNIEYEGSVEVHGNVCANFQVKARGNIIVRGVVENAVLIAGGDIIIERGVNGMGKGVLAARGNIVSRYLENVSASAGGYVSTDSILHSRVYAGTEVNVSGRRGFITGGQVRASSLVSVKTLGSSMGASTIIEVGLQPETKEKYNELQKQAAALESSISAIEPVLSSYEYKKSTGALITPEREQYVLSLRLAAEQKTKELEKLQGEIQKLQSLIDHKDSAQVAVLGEVYPGTKIVISEVSMIVQSPMQYCRFVKRYGDVKMIAY